MNFDLGPDQRDAAAGARAFFTGSASPAAARAALEGGAIEPGHKAMAEIGFLGITVAEDAGGAGGSLLDLAVVAEQGGAVLAGPSLVTAARVFEQAAETVIQVHGGIGFTWEHDAHLYWRRAKVDRFLLGDEAEHLDTVARLVVDGALSA